MYRFYVLHKQYLVFVNKKKAYKKGFTWGKREHDYESFTNWMLALTTISFGIGILVLSWCLIKASFILLIITFLVHLMARFCHTREKKFHKKAH